MRQPRRAFAAPLILTFAIPACIVASNKPPSNDPDRRGGTTTDHRGSGDDVTTVTNPPPPDTTEATEPAPDNTSERTWTVTLNDDGTCQAFAQVECPPDVACNPPRPRPVTCPEGISAGDSIAVHAAAGSDACFIQYGSGSCPPKATCNPPPPRKTACPQ